MAETEKRLPVKREERGATAPSTWRPFEDLHREIDRLFEDFGRGGWLQSLRPSKWGLEPHQRREYSWKAPVVDISETDKGFEITAEMPGMDARNVEVKLRNGNIVIKGEKREESEEKTKDYYVKERQFGAFERVFALPEGIDVDKIDARYHNGVLTVALPKSAEAKKPEKTISIKAA